MTQTGKSVAIILLSYLLFGLFTLFQFGEFVVPVVYTELVVFVMVTVSYLQNRKDLTKTHAYLFLFASIGLILHPFIWEIFLNQEQQFRLRNFIGFDILKILQWIALTLFFYFLSYDRSANKLKIEWLVPAILTPVCLFNPPMGYVHFLFILSGLSAFYSIRRRNIDDFIMEVLVGIGILNIINSFYLLG
jgi:hypothetical protein